MQQRVVRQELMCLYNLKPHAKREEELQLLNTYLLIHSSFTQFHIENSSKVNVNIRMDEPASYNFQKWRLYLINTCKPQNPKPLNPIPEKHVIISCLHRSSLHHCNSHSPTRFHSSCDSNATLKLTNNLQLICLNNLKFIAKRSATVPSQSATSSQFYAFFALQLHPKRVNSVLQ